MRHTKTLGGATGPLAADDRPADAQGTADAAKDAHASRADRDALRIAATSGCVLLSEHEADVIARVLDGERSARLLTDIRERRASEAGQSYPDHPHSLSELAILGHEIILFLRDRIEATREMGGARVEAPVLVLCCDFALRTSLDKGEDRTVLSALLCRAQAIVQS